VRTVEKFTAEERREPPGRIGVGRCIIP
jgi:hypothetical protein